jgi:hypothetical protein
MSVTSYKPAAFPKLVFTSAIKKQYKVGQGQKTQLNEKKQCEGTVSSFYFLPIVTL